MGPTYRHAEGSPATGRVDVPAPALRGAATTANDDVVSNAYATHAGSLRRGLTSSTHDVAVAEDLTQDAFICLVNEIRAGRMPDNVGAWLHRVAFNLAMSHGRHLAVVDRRSAEVVPQGNAPSPEFLAIEAERDDGLRHALDALEATDRRVLVMAAQGYRSAEIAFVIGRSGGATRTLLCRARTKLRGVIGETGMGSMAIPTGSQV